MCLKCDFKSIVKSPIFLLLIQMLLLALFQKYQSHNHKFNLKNICKWLITIIERSLIVKKPNFCEIFQIYMESSRDIHTKIFKIFH